MEVNELEANLRLARYVPRKHIETWSQTAMLVWKSQCNNYAPLMMRGLPADVSQSHRYQCYSCGRTTRYWFNGDPEIVAKEKCSCYAREDLHVEEIRLGAAEITDILHKNWIDQIMQLCRCEFDCAVNDGSSNWYKKHWL